MDIFPNNTDTYDDPLSEREHGGKSGITYTPCLRRIDGSYHTGLIWAWARSVSSKIGVAVFEGNDTADFDFNSIQIGDNVETVIDKMGLSELGKKCCLVIVSPVTFELSQDGNGTHILWDKEKWRMKKTTVFSFMIRSTEESSILSLRERYCLLYNTMNLIGNGERGRKDEENNAYSICVSNGYMSHGLRSEYVYVAGAVRPRRAVLVRRKLRRSDYCLFCCH